MSASTVEGVYRAALEAALADPLPIPAASAPTVVVADPTLDDAVGCGFSHDDPLTPAQMADLYGVAPVDPRAVTDADADRARLDAVERQHEQQARRKAVRAAWTHLLTLLDPTAEPQRAEWVLPATDEELPAALGRLLNALSVKGKGLRPARQIPGAVFDAVRFLFGVV